jgi:hypothetical protein
MANCGAMHQLCTVILQNPANHVPKGSPKFILFQPIEIPDAMEAYFGVVAVAA